MKLLLVAIILFIASVASPIEVQQQARDIFAHIQQNGDLKQMLANFKDEPVNFQHDFMALGPNEVKVMQQTFEQLANEAEPGSQLQQIYFDSARSAAEWSS